MVAALLLLSAGLLPAAPGDVTLDDRATYEAAKARAGRDADAHVTLALWCESHGLEPERIRHLALAAIIDPKHVLARGLLGLVEYRGRWQRPEAVGEAAGRDALLAEYRGKRDAAANTADAQWALAVWCEQAGLNAEAAAHFRTVTMLDPRRDAAWKRQGYKRQGGRWVTEAQLAAEKAEADLQKHADRRWKPLFEKWRDWLVSKARRDDAERALAEVTDPRAVPMLWATFVVGKHPRQEAAVRVLGQIDAPDASRALAMLAVFGNSAEIRRTAAETVRRRDAREFADLLVGLVRDPIKYEVKPVAGPGSPGELFIHGEKADLKRRYAPPAGPNVAVQPGDRVGVDKDGLPVVNRYLGVVGQTNWMPARAFVPSLASGPLSPAQERSLQAAISGWTPWIDDPAEMDPFTAVMRRSAIEHPIASSSKVSFTVGRGMVIPVGQMELEARKSAVAAQQQLQSDVKTVEDHNAPISRLNERVLPILKEVAGQDLGDDRKTWDAWWLDQIGFRIMPQKASDRPTITEDVPLAYEPQPLPISLVDFPVAFRRMSCFGAGTLVQTLSGPRAIESLKVGDRVLTQDTSTGGLGYQPILVVHRNPPSKTLRIALGDETVVSSLFHRFWKAGHGWLLARDLAPGDTIRTLGGLVKVGAIEEGTVQPVFNLDVADDADFFVGRQGALVHDNTLPDLRLLPFDAKPDLAATSPAGASR